MRRYALLSSMLLLACGDDAASPRPDASTPRPRLDAGITDDASSAGNPPGPSAGPGADGGLHAQLDGSPQAQGDAASGGDDTGLPGWRLVWNDEFTGASGTLPDASRWT